MIIRLDNSLIKYCKLNSPNPTHLEYFELFADIKIRGFHFLIAERSLLEVLGNLDKLSDRTRLTYRKLFQNYTTEKSIENNIDFNLKISSYKSVKTAKNVNIFIDELDFNSFLSRNKLLLENTLDADIFQTILMFYRNESEHSNIQYQWDVSNGGGSTTYSEYQRILNEKLTYTFCIIDSDKYSPHCNLGSTAKAFTKKPRNLVFGKHYIMEAHEMENLYPSEILLGMCKAIPSYKRNYLNLEKFLKDKNCSSSLYFDLKNGLSTCAIHKMDKKSKLFWEEILCKHNISYKKCSCEKNCDKFIIYPFGRKIGEEIQIFIKKINLNIEELLTDNYKRIWKEIGKLLFEIFCCPKFIVSI